MKAQYTLLLGSLFSLSAWACPNLDEIDFSKIKQSKVTLLNGKSMELDLPNMHCGGCAAKVKQIMSKYPDLAQAKIDLGKRKATLSCADGKTSCDAGAAIYDLKMAGYMIEK